MLFIRTLLISLLASIAMSQNVYQGAILVSIFSDSACTLNVVPPTCELLNVCVLNGDYEKFVYESASVDGSIGDNVLLGVRLLTVLFKPGTILNLSDYFQFSSKSIATLLAQCLLLLPL